MQVSDILGSIDVTSIGGIAVVSYLLVGVLKRAFSTWVSGKEELLAVAGAVATGIVMKKFGGGFADMPWGTLIVQSLVAGVFAQLIHDKVMDPLLNAVDKTPKKP
jgi:hypothetical protein